MDHRFPSISRGRALSGKWGRPEKKEKTAESNLTTEKNNVPLSLALAHDWQVAQPKTFNARMCDKFRRTATSQDRTFDLG
jgi:hypothetical protein